MAKTKTEILTSSSTNGLMSRLKKSSIIDETCILSGSNTFSQNLEMTSTGIPMMNVALSGELNGGFASGVTIFAGESKRFKTLFSLLCAASYMRKYPDAVLLFYDSEFGTPQAYFDSLHIDTSRVLHTPVTTVEQLRSDIANQLNEIKRGDHVFIMIDSIGSLASAKEVNDAVDNKTTADMTRAKQIKSLFRIITPLLTLRDVPCFVIAHTYGTMEMFSKEVVSGGRGVMLAADSVFIVGKRTDKDDSKDVSGYHFILNVEKSRFVKEKSKIAITVSYDAGVEKYSGILDVAVDLGFVVKPKQGWYAFKDNEEKLYRASEFNSSLSDRLLSDLDFQKAVESKFKVGYNSLFNEDTNDE